jgi:hypothetical protein
MMVGAMAVIGLQAHAIRSNAHARRLSLATEIAQRWIERLKEDAHSWTVVGTDPGSIASAFVNTAYLGENLTAVSATPDVFMTLPTTSATVSNAFDARGRDQTADGSQAFCVSYRRSWIWEGHLMRVDVRVFWPREIAKPDGTHPNFAQDFSLCADDGLSLSPGGAHFAWYHAVYLSTTLRVNEVRR